MHWDWVALGCRTKPTHRGTNRLGKVMGTRSSGGRPVGVMLGCLSCESTYTLNLLAEPS
jgi:hypothetical protein